MGIAAHGGGSDGAERQRLLAWHRSNQAEHAVLRAIPGCRRHHREAEPRPCGSPRPPRAMPRRSASIADQLSAWSRDRGLRSTLDALPARTGWGECSKRGGHGVERGAGSCPMAAQNGAAQAVAPDPCPRRGWTALICRDLRRPQRAEGARRLGQSRQFHASHGQLLRYERIMALSSLRLTSRKSGTNLRGYDDLMAKQASTPADRPFSTPLLRASEDRLRPTGRRSFEVASGPAVTQKPQRNDRIHDLQAPPSIAGQVPVFPAGNSLAWASKRGRCQVMGTAFTTGSTVASNFLLKIIRSCSGPPWTLAD